MKRRELTVSDTDFITKSNQCPKCFRVLETLSIFGKNGIMPGTFDANCLKCKDKYRIKIKLRSK